MKLNIEDKSTVKKVLHIEIPKEDVGKALNKAYNELKNTATIKGFRKGKIPRKVLVGRFAKEVHSDVAPRLIQDAFSEAMDEHKFNIVGGPQLDPPELDPDNDYVFDITIEVRPEIEDIDIKGIPLKKTRYEASQEEVDAQIHMIRKTMATKKKVEEERAVSEKDFVLIDYQGFVDGQPLDEAPLIENYVMAIGSKSVPDEFSEKLQGVIPEKEIEVDVVYAEDASQEGLAGKTVTYKIKLKEIQEEVLPPEDDALVENLGQYKDLEELKAAIFDNLKKGYEQRIQHELSEQIFTYLLEKTEFEVPEGMIDSELEGIVAEAEQAYQQNNMSLEEMGLSKDFMRSQYRDVAEKQARRHLLLGKIIEQEKLEMTPEELDESFKAMADGMGATVDAIKNYFKMDERQLEYYTYTQLEKKAVRIIIEQGDVTEVEPDAATDAAGEGSDAPSEETVESSPEE